MATNVANAAEMQVRQLLESWTRAVRGRNLKEVLAHHAQDVVMFDVPPPDQWRGIKAYKSSWELFFRNFPEHGGIFEIKEMAVETSSDLAFAYGILRCGDRKGAFNVRLTMCLRRLGAGWSIVHEHHSVPAVEA